MTYPSLSKNRCPIIVPSESCTMHLPFGATAVCWRMRRLQPRCCRLRLLRPATGAARIATLRLADAHLPMPSPPHFQDGKLPSRMPIFPENCLFVGLRILVPLQTFMKRMHRGSLVAAMLHVPEVRSLHLLKAMGRAVLPRSIASQFVWTVFEFCLGLTCRQFKANTQPSISTKSQVWGLT